MLKVIYHIIPAILLIGWAQSEPMVEIRSDFPGGNVLVTKNEGNTIHLEPDLRGGRPWFYWLFEAKASQPGTMTFVFPEKVAGFKNGGIGFQGPAISRDGGKSWVWMGTETVTENRLLIEFKQPGETIRLGVTIPYTNSDLDSFLSNHRGNPHLTHSELTRSKKAAESTSFK